MRILSGVGDTVTEAIFLRHHVIFLSISHTGTQKSIIAVCHTSCHSTEEEATGIMPVEMARWFGCGGKRVALPMNYGFSIFSSTVARINLAD